MKKRLISLMVSLSMLMSICIIMPNSASAATSGTCGTNLRWVLDNAGTLTISGTGGYDKLGFIFERAMVQ